jgi:hypothetical protein
MQVITLIARYHANGGAMTPIPAGRPRDVGEFAFNRARLHAMPVTSIAPLSTSARRCAWASMDLRGYMGRHTAISRFCRPTHGSSA